MIRVLPVTALVVEVVPPAETSPVTKGRYVAPAVPMVSVLSVIEPFSNAVPLMPEYVLPVDVPVAGAIRASFVSTDVAAAYATGAPANTPPTESATNAASCRFAFIPLSIVFSPSSYGGKNSSLQRRARYIKFLIFLLYYVCLQTSIVSFGAAVQGTPSTMLRIVPLPRCGGAGF